jgi:5-methylthioadenosine/S-adenosylhomocysteine deaminase
MLMRRRELLTLSWEDVKREAAKRAARLVEGL